MKKYVITLLLLIGLGVALAYFTIQQNLQHNEEVYLKTTASIRNLKLIDNSINLLLFKARHQNQNNYDELEDLVLALNEEFDNLRFEALFEEIEKSSTLSKTTVDFEEALRIKEENIAGFIEKNQSLMQASDDFLSSSGARSPIRNIVKKLSIEEEINALNIHFYQYLQDNTDDNKRQLNNSIAQIDALIESSNEDDQGVVYGYIKTLSDVIINTEETQKLFIESVNLETSRHLNRLEQAYVNYQNRVLETSSHLKIALIVYGFILLIALVFFAYMLWRHYQNLEQEVADRTEEIAQAYDDLKESQEQLIQSEKMASLGEMVAGVAHEINTPLGYVSSNVDTVKLNFEEVNDILNSLHNIYQEARSPKRSNKRISQLLTTTLKHYIQIKKDDVVNESQQLLDDSSHGLEEISELVRSLKDFARLDRQSTAEINIHDCIENSLRIATNHIRENNVAVIREFDELPNITCIPSKLNQLFLNIITNGCQAMKQDGGQLTIKTRLKDDNIILSFNDQGVGMDEETVQRMFDPFFTSKPIGEGTGLGMSIAYKIVQAHNGNIQVKSKPNVGTTLAVQLPINSVAGH